MRTKQRWALGLQSVFLTWGIAQGAGAQTRVACVGDSITEGYGINGPGYPEQLQELLGSGYSVENFGVSGSTALKAGDKPYWNESAFQRSDAFDPEIVLLMLGTNDAKPYNWNAEAFSADYTALVQHYLEAGAAVLAAAPPAVFGAGAFEISPQVVSGEVIPLVQSIAESLGIPSVDVYAATVDHGELFPDNVHPNGEGAGLLAQTFADAVTQLEEQGAEERTDAGAQGTAVLDAGVELGGASMLEPEDPVASGAAGGAPPAGGGASPSEGAAGNSSAPQTGEDAFGGGPDLAVAGISGDAPVNADVGGSAGADTTGSEPVAGAALGAEAASGAAGASPNVTDSAEPNAGCSCRVAHPRPVRPLGIVGLLAICGVNVCRRRRRVA